MTGIDRLLWRVLTGVSGHETAKRWRETEGERHTQAVYEIPFVLQEGPVATLAGNVLGTSEINVDGVTVRLEKLGRGEELVGVIRAELNDQWSVLWATLLAVESVEVLFSVGLPDALGEHLPSEDCGEMTRT